MIAGYDGRESIDSELGTPTDGDKSRRAPLGVDQPDWYLSSYQKGEIHHEHSH